MEAPEAVESALFSTTSRPDMASSTKRTVEALEVVVFASSPKRPNFQSDSYISAISFVFLSLFSETTKLTSSLHRNILKFYLARMALLERWHDKLSLSISHICSFVVVRDS